MQPYLLSLAVVVVVVVVLYNSLVSKRNAVENAFASIDVFLKKRFDLIPNLVAVVRQYARHEAETLTKVAEQRARATAGAANSEAQVALNNQLTAGLGRLMVVAESYPQLKADEQFKQLQRAINEVEEQLSASRRAFNAAVTDFNNAVEMFPTSLLASWMGCTRRTLFAAPEAERANPNTDELFKR